MKNKKALSNKLISLQLKNAIFLAFKQAKIYGSNTISSKFLLYGLLKTNNSLASRSLNSLYRNQVFSVNKVDKLLLKCEAEFKNNKNKVSVDNTELIFTRSIRHLLFLIIKSIKTDKISVINTFQVFNLLIRNKSLKKWIKQTLIDE